MFQELKPDEFDRVRSLFKGFNYSLSIQAAIQGNNPGRIFVDNPENPQTALALTVEGYLLAGANDNPDINQALAQLIKERIFSGEVFVNGDWSMSLGIYPQSWEARLAELIPTHQVEKVERYHYLCREVKLDWRMLVPQGYLVKRVDRTLLEDPEVRFSEALSDWTEIEEMWGSIQNFLEKGISYCVLHEGQVVAWCTPDCTADKQMDVGVVTDPAHRRRGLAAIAVAATVEHCLSHGFDAVGWHCNVRNTGSWKTAEKVGFERHCKYAYYYYIYNLTDHLAELGWDHYQRQEYAQTVDYYEQVFARREKNPDYYYHLAASAWALLGNQSQALKYLHKAVEMGWEDADTTAEQDEFAILHGTPEWSEILSQMRSRIPE